VLDTPNSSIEQLGFHNHSNLPKKILEWLFWSDGNKRRKALLERNSHLRRNASRSDIEDYICNLFAEYEQFKTNGIYFHEELRKSEPRAREVYEDIWELLIISWIAELITAWDWSVNRMDLAENTHGFKKWGFSKLQRTLQNKYWDDPEWSSPIHLHKWPGNGILPFSLISENSSRWQDSWEQYGVWDKLYFPIENIVYDFINENFKERKAAIGFVNILSTILKLRLKNRWFQAQTASIQKWSRKSQFCDVNDIYDELRAFFQDPKDEILNIYNPKTGKIKVSKYFEFDDEENLHIEIQWVLLKLLWYSDDEISQKLTQSYISRIKWARKPLRWRIQRLQQINNRLKRTDFELSNNPILRDIRKLTQWEVIPDVSKMEDEQYRESLIVRIWDYIKYVRNSLVQSESFEKLWSDRLWDKICEELWLTWKGSIEYAHSLLTDEFKESLLSESPRLDLNKKAHMYFWDFSLGYFIEIPDLIDKPVHLISATRSDSHETEEQFEQDIYQNLKQLAPWWVLTTDGIKWSFTSIYRFREVQKAIDKLWIDNFKVEVVLDTLTNRPLTVFVQKKHHKWYLDDAEKAEFFSESVSFESIEDTLSRPYIKIADKVRRRLLRITKTIDKESSVDVFQELQKHVKEGIENELMRELIEKKFSDNPYFQSLLDAYNEVCTIIHDNVSIQSTDSTEILLYLMELEWDKISYELRMCLHDPNLEELMRRYKWGAISKKDLGKKVWVMRCVIDDENSFSNDSEYVTYLREQIRQNKSTKALDGDDIKNITRRVESILESKLSEYSWEVANHKSWDLRPIRPWEIHTYPRLWEMTDINRSLITHTRKLPNNQEFWKMSEVLDIKKSDFMTRVWRWREQINSIEWVRSYKPICFISYDDCITNRFMLSELKRIFGNSFVTRNIEIISLWFKNSGRLWDDLIRHITEIQRKIQLYIENGWIILWWGSWTDAYDEFGAAYKDQIWWDILEAMELNPNLRQLIVCASYQIGADMIWKRYYQGNVITRPGMMQFWATSVWKTKEKWSWTISHPVFEGFPDYFTVSMTHTWWVNDLRSKSQQRETDRKLQFIATDMVTWNPLAYTAMNDQIFWIQWHPEIDLTNPQTIQELGKELKLSRSLFEDIFRVKPETVINNFDTGWYIKDDSWKAVLISSLEFLSRNLSGIS